MFSIYDLFDEYETNVIRVSDFGIVTNGTLVDYIVKKGNDVEIWAGNIEDDYAEQLILSKEERKRIFEEIIENF